MEPAGFLRSVGGARKAAFDLDLVIHQKAGFDHDRLQRELLPDGFAPGTMTAIGYAADPEHLPDEERARKGRARRRRPLGEFVYGPDWGNPAPFLTSDGGR